MASTHRSPLFLCLAALALAAGAQCSRGAQSPTVQPDPGQHPAPAPPAPATATPPPPAAPEPPAAPVAAAVQPAGPRAELQGDHYRLVVALAPPPATPGASTMTLELRAGEGYHMNDLYPTQLALTASNATAPAVVRRAEGTITQELVSFRVPVQVASAGAVVRGTARFAVCSADTCIPQTRDFAVNLP